VGARIDCDGVRSRRQERLSELLQPVGALSEDGDLAAFGGNVFVLIY